MKETLIDTFLFVVGMFLVWANIPYLGTNVFNDVSFLCGVICMFIGAFLLFGDIKDYLK
jgi:hypothetical protein